MDGNNLHLQRLRTQVIVIVVILDIVVAAFLGCWHSSFCSGYYLQEKAPWVCIVR